MAAVSGWLDRTLEVPAAAAIGAPPPPSRAFYVGAGLSVVALAVIGAVVMRPSMPAVVPVPRPVVVQQPVETPPPLPVVTPPAEVVLNVVTTPSGAKVFRLDTGALAGLTPLTLRVPKANTTLRLRFELTGHQPLEREAALQSDQTLELSLRPVVQKMKPRPVTDGVLDPF